MVSFFNFQANIYSLTVLSPFLEGCDLEGKAKYLEIFDAREQTFIKVIPVEKSDEEWFRILGVKEYEVARKGGTEAPFTGQYYESVDEGIYACVCCGTDLFFSSDKYASGTGWPSFTRPVSEKNIEERSDHSYGMIRTEVRCRRCGAHLGHVFDDGPPPTHLRYCINSASLEFVPAKAT
jgi:peptide-methionine (R)-S-oxide reductase